MKRIFLILTAVSAILFAETVTLQKSFETTLAEAARLERPIMMVVSSKDCQYCDLFEDETLADPLVAKALNRDFVSSVLFPDKGDRIPEPYHTGSTPTIWFLLPDGNPMFAPVMGAVPPAEFIKILAIVHDAYTNPKPQ
jgi:thioredoxin-related protein